LGGDKPRPYISPFCICKANTWNLIGPYALLSGSGLRLLIGSGLGTILNLIGLSGGDSLET
jgi:hypothetical protein